MARLHRRTVRRRPHQGGFTLIELLVAMTGGFLIAVTVFALARSSTRFFQSEARLANTTFSGVVGFQRLRADIARAGFLGSPNIRRDPTLCGSAAGWAASGSGSPAELSNLAGVKITVGGSPSASQLDGAGLDPDSVILAGSYASAEQYPINTVEAATTNYDVFLQPNSGPLSRTGAAGMAQVFQAGRALRIVDPVGRLHFATIVGYTPGTQPKITVSNSPALQFRAAGTLCGLRANVVGALVNVVNFIHYDVRPLSSDSRYAWVYASAFGDTYDAGRTELVREELDVTGAPISGTQELVAEYAVDLKFGVTAVTAVGSTGPETEYLDFGAGEVDNYSTDTSATVGPHRLRAVRARLSVRSREPDRVADTAESRTYPGQAPYRISLGGAGAAPFARVRTLQADVALRNQLGVTW